jgi:hypothetical protein
MLLPPFYKGLSKAGMLNPQTASKMSLAATSEKIKRLLTLSLAKLKRNTKAIFKTDDLIYGEIH